jgi:hypothetical protein
MARPRRLYLTSSGKYYYIVDGKKKYLKVPVGMSQKQVQQINIKNIIGAPAKRIKRKKKKVPMRYTKKITTNDMLLQTTGGLPGYVFQPGKKILSLTELAEKADDSKNVIDLLKKAFLDTKKKDNIGLPPVESAIKKGINIKTEYEKAMDFIKSERPIKKEPPVTPKNLFGDKESITPISNMGQRGFTPKVPPSTSDVLATRLKKLKERPSVKDLEQRRNEGVAKVKYYTDKADKLTKVLIEKNYITSAEIPQNLTEWNALGLDLGLIKREYDNFNDVIDAISAKFSEMKGFGINGDDGLYNDQIEKIMKKRLDMTVPVVARDQVDSLLDKVYNKDFFSAVINTDPSSSSGRHWRCIVIDNRDDFPSAEYFDPLCESTKPEAELLDVMRKICKRMNPEKYMKYKFSKIRRQSFLKSNCGYHVMRFIEDRYNGVPFEDASGYKDFMMRQKGKGEAPDDSMDGEGDLKKYEKEIKTEFSEYL